VEGKTAMFWEQLRGELRGRAEKYDVPYFSGAKAKRSKAAHGKRP
jgi:hypothetical protein